MKLYVTRPALAVAACLAVVTAVGPRATAQAATPEEVVAQIIELNKKAVGAYKAGQADAAMADLEAAEKLGRENGLDRHDMLARTHVHLGIVAIAGLKQRNRGLEHFARALQIRPRIKLTPTLATRALKRDLRIARRVKLPPLKPVAVAAAPAAPAPTAAPAPAEAAKPDEAPAAPPKVARSDNPNEPPMPSAVPQPLYCPTPDRGPPGQPMPLFCLFQPGAETEKVVAFFRTEGADLYTAVPMKRSASGWLKGLVPAKAVRGRSLQVYFEAQDPAGNAAINNGKDELPHVISIKEGAPRVSPRALALIEVGSPPPADEPPRAEETPLEIRERAAEQEEVMPKGRPRRAPGSLYVGLGIGSSYGWHRELPLERRPDRQVTTGFSPTGFGHVSPEIGYQLTPRLSVSVQSRHQYLPASGSGDAEVTGAPPQMAHAILARLQVAMFSLGDLQFTGSLSAGGGSALRMSISPNRRLGLAASDTIVAGPLAGGPGLGLAYNFTPHFMVVAEARALVGAPAFAVLMEGTGGVQISF